MGPLRTLEFDEQSGAQILRDTSAVVCALLHTQRPVVSDGPTALDAAESYLLTHAEQLGLSQSQLTNLRLRLQDGPVAAAVEYRLLSEKRQFDVTTVTFQEIRSGLPTAPKAGISVHVKQVAQRFEILCAQIFGSGQTPGAVTISEAAKALFAAPAEGLALGAPSPGVLSAGDLARQLGIAGGGTAYDDKSLEIRYQHLAVHRFDAAKRTGSIEGTPDAGGAEYLAVPLPAVPAEIVDGGEYLVLVVYFDLALRDSTASFHWMAVVDVDTRSVLYIDCFAAGINGSVFVADPMTTHGGPRPSATNSELNPLRVLKPLLGLAKPDCVPGLNPECVQRLKGENVRVADLSGPLTSPPVMPKDEDFEFDVRSDDFAAVNAYYHCDRFFRLVENLGFKRDEYFPGTKFPITADHRGRILSSNMDVNARCIGTTTLGPTGEVIGGIRGVAYGLAEATTPIPPIGIANDWRVTLHELGGHGILLNHVGISTFRFAHSAGDSLAAILNAPDSQAEHKGVTFPWIAHFARRHDQPVEDWAWDGEKDLGGDQMEREQILSTTHFRFYEAIGGGEAAPVSMRHFAARYATYLILRSTQTLTPATNPQHASDWVLNLVVADSTDWTSEKHAGGAYEKVIRWAFEKQGLFGGNPPDIDACIDDGRGGEYQYQIDHASCPAIWNRHANDGLESHQTPVTNVVNHAYVKIGNRGSRAAKSVVVRAFQNNKPPSSPGPVHPAHQLFYPDDWQPVKTPELAAADLAPHSGEIKVGPFEWIPSPAGTNYILMAVSAEGDPSNLAKFATGRSIPDWRLVPHDNNLGLRKV